MRLSPYQFCVLTPSGFFHNNRQMNKVSISVMAAAVQIK